MGATQGSFYAVFDGHAGFEASHFCQKNLQRKLVEMQNF